MLKLSTRVPDQPPLVGGKFLEMDLADLIDTDDDETLKIRNLVMNEGLTSNQVLLKHPESVSYTHLTLPTILLV